MFHVKHFQDFIESCFQETLESLCAQNVLSSERKPVVTSTKLEKLAQFVELLGAWTKKLDLVAPAAPETLIERHLADAFSAWALLSARGFFQSASLDIGSGAGLPGLVFAILSEDSQFILCEPREKRVVFLQEAKRRLSLSCCQILNKRLEALSAGEVKEVELYLFRALKPEPAYREHLSSICSPGSKIAFLTGSQQPDFGKWEEHIPYHLSGDTRGRYVSLANLGN